MQKTLSPQESPTKPNSGITLRAIVLCLALAVLFGYLLPLIDVKLSNTFLGATHLPPGAVGALLVLLLVVNPLLGLVSKKWRFSRNETLTVYISCLFSSLVPGHGSENFIVSNLVGPFYYATRENKWLEFLQPMLKPFLTPSLNADGSVNTAVVEGWYMGLRPGEAIPWGAWLTPLLMWSAVIVASYVMLGCLSVILRAQWAGREALAFPLLRLPLEMTEGAEGKAALPPFFRNPAMWMGFGIAVSIQMLNGLHLYFPDVPEVPLGINTGALFTDPPWNQMGWFNLQIYPIAVGIAFLLTSEVGFSLPFFFLFIKFQYIVAYTLGYPLATLPSTYGLERVVTSLQVIGAFWMYVALVVWTGREHLLHVAKRALGREKATDDEKTEALSYPVAFWGFVLAFVFMLVWCAYAGVRIDVALALLITYLVICLGLSRLVAEAGVLFVAHGWQPFGFFATIANAGPGTWLPVSTLAPGSLVQAAFMIDTRAFIMPSFIQSFKLAHDQGIRAKPLLALISVVVLITFGMSMWMSVKLGYENSGLSLNSWYAVAGPKHPPQMIASLQNGVPHAGPFNLIWFGLGAAITFACMMARSRFAWFPLHPIGYLMCITYPMQKIWFSILLGWTCKSLITKFGGTDSYRKAIPGFLGLALGDVAMMLFWLVIDGWQGRIGHIIVPA